MEKISYILQNTVDFVTKVGLWLRLVLDMSDKLISCPPTKKGKTNLTYDPG